MNSDSPPSTSSLTIQQEPRPENDNKTPESVRRQPPWRESSSVPSP